MQEASEDSGEDGDGEDKGGIALFGGLPEEPSDAIDVHDGFDDNNGAKEEDGAGGEELD